MGRRESDCEIVFILKDAPLPTHDHLRFENVPFETSFDLYELYETLDSMSSLAQDHAKTHQKDHHPKYHRQ